MNISAELPINIIIKNGKNQITKLINKANLLKKIEHSIQQLLPNHLQDKFRLINNKNNCLTLGCESAAFAHQLKFLLPELLSNLRKKDYGSSIASITCRVIPFNKSIKKTTTLTTPNKQKNLNYKNQLKITNSDTTDHDLQKALDNLHQTLQKY